MATYGILADYDWCTGCHSCEIACQMEHGFPIEQTGIKVLELGNWEITEETWQYSFLPAPTDQCDLCANRLKSGKPPSCVQHCQASCLSFGKLEDLEKELVKKPKQTLFSL
jgi:anaerobic dimethyl sulfoxide reductase subunit B (iron-sulfur subunit)